jgi:hypothetical protein
VVDAVRCAIEVQNGLVERNAGLPPERRIEFRIGVHLGDVVEEADGDLMGDGVNIAAQLEGILRHRHGSYRLPRLAAKYGPEISLHDLTEPFSYECLLRAEARSKVRQALTNRDAALPRVSHSAAWANREATKC